MKRLALILYIVVNMSVYAQMLNREPSIGYVFPAGAQKGSDIQLTIGGQNLQGVSGAYITGEGISVKSVIYVPPLNANQRKELQRRIEEIRKKWRGISTEPAPASQEEPPVTLPPHPLLNNLDNFTPKELKKVVDIFITPFRRLQRKRSIEEMVLVDIHIEENASPGNREIRLLTQQGITNPLCFQVGVIPEVIEDEPNDPNMEGLPVYNVPVLFNGQIMPGDVDRFVFHSSKGQKLIIEAQARQLIPYMADAVPGWFQATLALYDSKGKQLAYVDDYRFNPDPIIFFEVPEDGDYTVEIKDSIYRGREDFVYRLSISERPFVTSIFPPGGKTGTRTLASVKGINLPEKQLLLDTSPEGRYIRKAFLYNNNGLSNPVLYRVDNLPEYTESRSNNSIDNAERITIPVIINGAIEKPGDVDTFKFDCVAGSEIVAEVYGRRIDSPIDSLLRIMDRNGKVLVWNDDSDDKASGLITHQADSYIYFKVPEDGTYLVQISDAQGYGGDEYTYRLRISYSLPDFTLIATPSALNIPAGCSIPFDIHIIRRDGFNGTIELYLKDMPEGFSLSGGYVPQGKNIIHLTLTAPIQTFDYPLILNIEGKAEINGKTIVHPVIPAENMIQAFGPTHLVPSESFLAMVLKPGFRNIPMSILNNLPLKISGGTAEVQVKVPPRMAFEEVMLELKQPPDGISLEDVAIKNNLLTFKIKADNTKIKDGFTDNLIVEVFTNSPVGPKDEKGNRTKQKISRGFLPAIPVVY